MWLPKSRTHRVSRLHARSPCVLATLRLCVESTAEFRFKEGRLPGLWREFQALLRLVSNQCLREHLPNHTRRLYRWIEGLAYVDSEGRRHTLNALLCEETSPASARTTFARLTDLPLNRQTVLAVSHQGGRLRSTIENEGFNVQKSSGLNLEHAYSLGWTKAKAYYLLLQLGHLFFQLLEKGSLLRALAAQYAKTTVARLPGRPRQTRPAPAGGAALFSLARRRHRSGLSHQPSSRTPSEPAGCGWSPGSSAPRLVAAGPAAAAATASAWASRSGQPARLPVCLHGA